MTAGRSVITLSQSWNTPPDIVDIVRAALGGKIALDPCSNEFSVVKAETEWTIDDDGLSRPWAGHKTIFVNPPYGRGIAPWLERCAAARNQSVIALIPVAVNTSHWKRFIFPSANHIAFLSDTRPKFWSNGEQIKRGAPMACCLVHWGTEEATFLTAVENRCNVVSPIARKVSV